VLVAPSFNVGMAQHPPGLRGNADAAASTFMAASATGPRRSRRTASNASLLNGHGGNVSTIEAAFSQIYAE
jgi:creatinine amidohydrolase/Fe(II)-dependent formamide hydrolase-like protein